MEDRSLLAADLAGREYLPNELLVQFAPNASTSFRALTRANIGGTLAETIFTRTMQFAGEGVLERVKFPPNVAIEKVIDAMQRMPSVKYVEPNYVYRPMVVSDDTYYSNGSLWGMYGGDAPASVGPIGTTNPYGIDAERAWNENVTGSSSVVVGIIDEGVQVTHPDLAGNMWVNPYDPVDGVDNDGNGYIDDVNGWDFVNNDNSVYDAGEDSHGTHVAGTIGGVGGNGSGVVGVNWDVTMISTKFLGPNGGTTAGAIKALDYLVDLKTRHGINLVATNNSWGGGGYSQALHDAIIRAAKKDILFVAAAGNDGLNNDTTGNYPSNYSTTISTTTESAANYDSVIAVASITSSGSMSSFSNYGASTVDIGAPGSGIYSSVPTNSYASYSGTSMATPHVTGAIALYASLQPTPVAASTIRSAILSTATPTSSLEGRTSTGGRLNVYDAIQSAHSIVLDKSAYGLPSTITITVRNSSANANGTAIDNVVTQISSSSETTPEIVTLSETGPNTSIFTGKINLVSGSVAVDGQLQAATGDEIVATTAGISKSAVAVVDTIAPTISAVTAVPRATGADVTWITDETATTEVLFGLSPTSLSRNVSDANLVATHRAVLTGLSGGATYYYQVRSRDMAGNVTSSLIESFTTPVPAPILFVDDDQGASYERFFTAAFQANSYSFDSWDVSAIGTTPMATELAGYDVVVWNTGYDFSNATAGLSTAEQSAIQSYLNGGGRIFISGQDILYNGVSSTFRQNYLKVAGFQNDVAYISSETGVVGNAIGNGMSLALTKPADYPALYIDAITPVAGAEATFQNNVAASYAYGAVNYRGNYSAGGFGVVFMAFPFEAISASAANPNNQATVMKRVVEFLGGVPTPGVTVSSPTSASTTEAGGVVSFTVVLNTAPTADVTIPVYSNDATEGTSNVASLRFTSSDWSFPKTVTVSGIDDSVDDGNVSYKVVLGMASSSDGHYDSLDPTDISLFNEDDDVAGVTVSVPTPGNATTEAGGAVSFSIKLNSEPTANVAIAISSGDTTEGLPSVSSLTFTPANWSTEQTVIVTGVDDSIYDGNVAYTIVTSATTSTDSLYSARAVPDVSLVNVDNEPAPATKFFVVNDATTNYTYEYAPNGTAVENYSLHNSNATPRGVVAAASGDKVWVIDASRTVHVYDGSGNRTGSWGAGTIPTNANVQGIATDGVNIWIVDAKSDRVYYYANAATLTGFVNPTQIATGNWALGSGNTNPTDLVFGTVGTAKYLWVVNDASANRVYRYYLNSNGSIVTSAVGANAMISWALNSANATPTGITLDPTGTSGSDSIWVVDSATRRVYQYTNAKGTTVATTNVTSFPLSPGNTNPQGIADPPVMNSSDDAIGAAEAMTLRPDASVVRDLPRLAEPSLDGIALRSEFPVAPNTSGLNRLKKSATRDGRDLRLFEVPRSGTDESVRKPIVDTASKGKSLLRDTRLERAIDEVFATMDES